MEHARLRLLIEAIVLLVAQEADHLIPISSPWLADAPANRATVPPEMRRECMLHHRRARLVLSFPLLLNRPAGEEGHADRLDIARGRRDPQDDRILSFRIGA